LLPRSVKGSIGLALAALVVLAGASAHAQEETPVEEPETPEAPEAYRAPAPPTAYGVTRITTGPAPPDLAAPVVLREDGFVSLHLDPLGFVQWGPVMKLEVGQTFTVHVRARLMNAGLANYFISSELPNDRFDWGIGFGAGVRYFTGVQRGFLVGFAFELHYAVWKVDSTGATSETWRICPALELGHRWLFGDQVIVGLGADIAYVGVVASDDVFATGDFFLAVPFAEIGVLL
jgi:hypothetical protein